MKVTYIEIEANADELKSCNTLSDAFRNLLVKVASGTNKEEESEEVEE